MANSVRLGKFFKINVELHYSWFFIFILLAFALSKDFFPRHFPDLTTTEYWIIGGISSVLLFASVLFHELSHSLVAKRHKMGVERITLFFFGGVAQLHENNLNPKTEFKMAAAGPLFSIVFGLFFLGVYSIFSNIYIQAVSFYLYRINFILAAFNLFPGFPLDGGRILRSILWYFTDDLKKSTRYAAGGGKLLALILITIGAGSMIILRNFGGLWFLFLGFFLLLIAELSYDQIIIKEILSKITAEI